jgi:predicted PurR-regulated permease PerM
MPAPEGPAPGEVPSPKARSLAHRTLIVTLVVVAVGAAVFLLWWTVHVVLFLFAGALLAVALRALFVPLAHKTRVPERVALGLTLVALAGAAVLFGIYLGPQVAEQFSQLAAELPLLGRRLLQLLERVPGADALLRALPEPGEMAGPLTELLTRAGGVVTSLVGGLGALVIIAVIGFYLAASPQVYVAGIVRLVPPPRRPFVVSLLEAVGLTLQWWLVGRVIVMVISGVLITVGLGLLGIPLALGLGVLAGLLTFVPYLGFLVAAVPILLFSFAQGIGDGVGALVVYLGVNVVENYFVEPLVAHKTVKVPPALGLGSQVLLGALAGVPAILVAAPLVAVLIVVVQRAYVEGTLGDLGAGDDELLPPSLRKKPRKAKGRSLWQRAIQAGAGAP